MVSPVQCIDMELSHAIAEFYHCYPAVLVNNGLRNYRPIALAHLVDE